MKKSKKLVSVIALIVLTVLVGSTLIACGNNTKHDYTIAVPDGTPALAVANLIADSKVGDKSVGVKIVPPGNIVAEIDPNNRDMLILPTNAAVAQYNKGANYKLVTSNIFGVLYILANNTAVGGTNFTLSDLKGQVLHSFGINNTPQFVLNKVLEENNIEYLQSETAVAGKVAVKYHSDANDIVPLVRKGDYKFCLLGEPAVSKVKNLVESDTQSNFSLLEIDLQQEWKQATGLSESYPQASLFVRSDILQNDVAFVNALIGKMKLNEQYLLDNADDVVSLLTKNGSTALSGATINADVIARCNFRTTLVSEIKLEMQTYLSSIGIAPKDDGIYFI